MQIWFDPKLDKKFRGDRQKARRFIRKARKYAAWLYRSLEEGQTFKTGVFKQEDFKVAVYVWKDELGKRATVKIYSEGKQDKKISSFIGVTWLPEGIVLVPRTIAAPYGYGFPRRDLETGEKLDYPGTIIVEEKDQVFNQVLINKFENNKYLDKPDFISGSSFSFPENICLRPSLEGSRNEVGFYQYWPVGYEPAKQDENNNFDFSFWTDEENPNNRNHWIDIPGINIWPNDIKKKWTSYKKPNTKDFPELRQFDENGNNLLFEIESENWFVHWPEENLYPNLTFETIYQETNRLRSEEGKVLLNRPVRGLGNPAFIVCAEVQRSSIQAHDDEENFRSGYGTAAERAALWSGIPDGAENLLTGPFPALQSSKTGKSIVELWQNSPGHYANIISDDWNTPKYGTSLFISGGFPVSISETKDIETGTQEFLDNVTGTFWAQIFSKSRYGNWVWAPRFTQKSDYGVAGILTNNQFIQSSFFLDNYTLEKPGDLIAVCHAGRPHIIKQVVDTLFDEEPGYERIIGVTVFKHATDSRLWLRAIVFNGTWDDSYLAVYIKPIASGSLEWKQEAKISTIDLGINRAPFIRTAVSWNKKGNQAIFTMGTGYEPEVTRFFTDTVDEAKRAYWRPVEVQYIIEDGFSTGTFLSSFPTIPVIMNTVTTATRPDFPSQTHIEKYERVCDAEYEYHPYYDSNGDIKRILQSISFHSIEHYTNDLFYQLEESIYLESGKEIQFLKINYDGANLTEESFVGSFLHLNPLTEDYVLAKGILRKSGTDVWVTLKIIVNDELVKTYPETQIRSAHRDGKITAYWDTVSGPAVGYRATDMIKDSLYSLASGLFRFVPETNSPGEFLKCTNNITPVYLAGNPTTGEEPLSFGVRGRDSNNACITYLHDEDWYVGQPSLPAGIPTGFLAEHECHFVRYKDRWVTEVNIKTGLLGVPPDNEPESDYIIKANFDLEGEVNVGELIQISPIGLIEYE